MTEEKGGDGGGGESARVSSSFAAVGGRQRFTVELRPGETTIVSWKKLLKDKSKVNGPTSAPEPPSNAHPALESRIAPGQPPAEKEVNDEPPATRFSAVIEKIERLYMGKHSSDEEDLNDVPDDDEYDTEDSFIDDAELDEYFQVDNSAIKHDGFFVNRGKLERINEPTLTPHLQPKKRRRKDLEKGHDDDDGHIPNKHVKIGKKAVGKAVPLVGKSFDSPIRTTTISTQHCEDVNFHNHMNASVICSKKKSNDIKNSLDPPPSKISNGNPSLTLAEENDIDKQKTGVVPFKNHGNKLKDGCEFSDASNQRSPDESSYAHFKSQTGKLSTSVDQSEQSVQRKEKSGIRDRPDIDGSEGKHSMQAAKVPLMHRKEGSSARPKSTMLEKSIRELHKMVTELRPPAGEITDADFSSQGIKKRLPPELKQKLAKVARLAQANQGKLSKELINRLMSILGHLMQLRTLKRHLKVMANMASSAKQEKDDKFQQIKKEVAEMIKTRVPSPKSKAVEHQAGSSDDFQETGNEKKEVKRKCSMDDAMEDKICDLYNLYVEGLDEDAGPQVRKLYAELAELWPNGCMDNHGIKRGICRAKDRRRALRHKEQQKIKRKKLLATRIEETVRAEASSISQPQYMQEKMITDSGNQSLSSLNRPVSNTTITSTTPSGVRTPGPLINNPSLDRPKQDKLKGNSRNPRTVEGLAKKKVKRKPELALGETHIRPEKKNSAPGEVRNKVQKQQVHVLALPQKPISQSSIPLPSSVQQS